MADITTRRQGEMLQAIFRVLVEEPEGLQAKHAIARGENVMDLTDFEKATFPKNPNVVRFPKIVRFATINSVKAGWLLKHKGVWTLTEDGRAALDKFPDAEALFRESRRLYRKWKAEQPDEASNGAPDESETTLLAATTLEEAEESARGDILGYMAETPPYRFQDLVAKLLEAMGYHVVWIAPKGPDGGLDLLAQTDPLGVTGPRIKGQVKRRADSKVSEDELRSFLSLIESHDVGLFISLGGFTRDAQRHARDTSRRVTLIDGEGLLDLWVEHYEGLDEDGRQLLPVKPVHFLDRDALG
ncbi:MAG: restriction endonuclease [Solirubrobacteraceae bacterium]